MNNRFAVRLFLVALAAHSAAAPPHTQAAENRLHPFTTPRDLVYDFDRQRASRQAAPAKRATSVACYVNTDSAGLYWTVEPGEEFIDWGILGGTATTKCLGLSDIVTGFTFAYATSTPDTSIGGPGASLTLTFYESYGGFAQDSGLCPVASYAFSGLPGFSGSSTGSAASSYRVAVDLTGGEEFRLPDGAFGYGFRSNAVGNEDGTGPLLCLTGDGVGGPEPCTGNICGFDQWWPDTKGVGTTWLFQPSPVNNFGSWYGTIARGNLSTPASASFRDAPSSTNLPGSIDASVPILGSTLALTAQARPGDDFALFIAFDTPLPTPLVLGGGQGLLCIDVGSGELFTGAGLPGTPVGADRFVATHQLSLNVELCGFTLCAFALTAQLGTPPFALTSAADLVLGG